MEKSDVINSTMDEARVCKECGVTFVVSASEVEYLKRRCGDSFNLPKRCPICRAKKGQIFRTVECAKCHEPFTISLLEKDDYIRRGLELPKRCPKCREKLRRRHGGRMRIYGGQKIPATTKIASN